MTYAVQPDAAQLVHSRWSSRDPADQFVVHDPSTGAELARVQGAGAVDVDAAVRAAHAACCQTDWRWRSPRERGRLLRSAGSAVREVAREIAELESREMGKPVAQAAMDVEFLSSSLEFFGGLADALPGDVHDAGALWAMTTLEPYGVIGGIIPFNWPPSTRAPKRRLRWRSVTRSCSSHPSKVRSQSCAAPRCSLTRCLMTSSMSYPESGRPLGRPSPPIRSSGRCPSPGRPPPAPPYSRRLPTT